MENSQYKALFEEVLERVKRVLGEKLSGFYLYGSLVSGGFVDGTSDMDFFALLADELSASEFDELDGAHRAFIEAHPEWENRLEIAYASQAALASLREKRSPIAVISPGEPFNIHEASEDWAINWYLLRTQGRRLYGMACEDAFPAISKAEFIEDVRAQAIEWGGWVEKTRELLYYQSYAVITMSRALYTIEHGEQPGKQEAADWVAVNFPEWAELIEWALNTRVAEEPDGDAAQNYTLVTAFVQFVIGQIFTGK